MVFSWLDFIVLASWAFAKPFEYSSKRWVNLKVQHTFNIKFNIKIQSSRYTLKFL